MDSKEGPGRPQQFVDKCNIYGDYRRWTPRRDLEDQLQFVDKCNIYGDF